MNSLRLVRTACSACLRGLVSLAVWTLWLALAAALAVQIWILCANQLALPQFVRRGIETRLAASGMSATFGQTRFDPLGRLLIENVALTLPAFGEPVVTARALYVRLDPWALAVGRIEPVELRATGVTANVPAMLSPSGRAEPLVRELDFALRPRGEEIVLDYASARIGPLAVSARGGFRPGSIQNARAKRLPLAQFLAQHYGTYSRRFAAALLLLQALDEPSLRLDLTPSETSGAIVRASLLARGLKFESPFAAQTDALSVRAQFPLAGAAAPVSAEISADNVRLPGSVAVRGALIRAEGTWDWEQAKWGWTRAQAAARAVSAEGLTLDYPLVSAAPGPLPKLQAEACALILGVPLSGRGDVDVRAGTIDARFQGGLSPSLIDFTGARLGRDLRQFVDFRDPARAEGEAWFGPAWRFKRTSVRVSVARVMAYHVPIDEARGLLEFDGKRLYASEAFARIGDDFARGSYENDLPTHRYRYLLDGRLRPLDITPWFKGKWWPQLFGAFSFPAEPPYASVDVRGFTNNGREAKTFAFVDSKSPLIEGAPFDRLLTRLFAQYQFEDAMEILAVRGAGSARGTFVRRADGAPGSRQGIDVDVSSNLDLSAAAKIPQLASVLGPFEFDRPPTVVVQGHFGGPAYPGSAPTAFDVAFSSSEGLRFHHFPLDRANGHATVRDQDIVLDRLALGFAGGTATGGARLSGAGADQKLSFQAALKDANLGRTIVSVEGFFHDQKGAGQMPPPGKFVSEKANVRFDVTADASGACADLASFSGAGRATVRGPDLLQVQLLGALSKLLTFSKLRFTTAEAKFTISGGRLIFPDISVTGANSAIEASGNYLFAGRHELDFNARVYPFQRSSSIPQRLLNVALTPFTSVMETRLTGPIENPKWSLALGLPAILRGGNPAAAPASPSPLRPAPVK